MNAELRNFIDLRGRPSTSSGRTELVQSILGACCGVALALALTTTPARAGADAGPVLGSDARVLAFGDSLTDGVGGSGENYPRRLAQLIGRPVINAGLSGETTAQGRQRLPDALLRERPTLLILCLGLNDLLRGVPDAEIRANLVAMIREARGANIEVLLLATTRPGTSQAHPLYAEAAEQGGAWLDAEAMVSVLTNPALKADLVHPNREGYRAIADALAERLRRNRRSRP